MDLLLLQLLVPIRKNPFRTFEIGLELVPFDLGIQEDK